MKNDERRELIIKAADDIFELIKKTEPIIMFDVLVLWKYINLNIDPVIGELAICVLFDKNKIYLDENMKLKIKDDTL